MNKSNEEQKFITFDDLKFETYDKYPSFSKRAFLTLDNDLHASVLEYSAEEQERHGCKYGIILRAFENYPIRLSNKGKCGIAGAATDQKLIKMLNVASKFPYDAEYDGTWFEGYESEEYKEYINLVDERDYSKNKPNEEKEFITWDDLKFEPYKILGTIDAQAAWAKFDLGSLHIIKRSNEDGSVDCYDCMRYTADDKQSSDAFDIRNTSKGFLNNYLKKLQREYGNGDLPEESVIERDFNPDQILTIEFNDSDYGKYAKVHLDSGLTVHITKYDKEKCIKNKGDIRDEDLEWSNKYMYRLSIRNYCGWDVSTDLSDETTFDSGGRDDDFLLLKNDKELYEALSMARLLDSDGNLHNEKTEATKSAEKEDRAKQSAERIRAKKKSVSGVYVADKIAEAMRSGVISEPVTPEKGKQLSDNIKKKYIMDQQQKS